MHTDRGSHGVAHGDLQRLHDQGIIANIRRTGNGFWSTFKRETSFSMTLRCFIIASIIIRPVAI